ncbi:MAG: hypothetical protein ACTHJR_18905 [Sphingomonas sp.]|uniref:hypothetical protein n=1 Tax=Sphingomonas sp. TaxID=28214 RepID=UPI003F809EF6
MRYPLILACVSGAALVIAPPAFGQGKKDRAEAAVAAAQAKVDAASKVGAAGEVPRLLAQAQAMLRTAQEDLAHDSKVKAIEDANHASMLADQALGEAQRAKLARARDDRNAANAAAADAARSAADANARAAAAEADANAARNAPPPPPVIIAAPPAPPPPAPAPTSTTVTTETVAPAAPTKVVNVAPRKRVVVKRRVAAKRHVVVRKAAPATVKTKTTVTTKSE